MITKRWSTRLGRISSQNYTICNDHYYTKCDIMNVKYIKRSFSKVYRSMLLLCFSLQVLITNDDAEHFIH